MIILIMGGEEPLRKIDLYRKSKSKPHSQKITNSVENGRPGKWNGMERVGPEQKQAKV